MAVTDRLLFLAHARGPEDGELLLLDWRKKRAALRHDFDLAVHSLAADPRGCHLAMLASSPTTLRRLVLFHIFRTGGLSLVQAFETELAPETASLAFDPDGDFLVSWGAGGAVSLWDPRGKAPERTLSTSTDTSGVAVHSSFVAVGRREDGIHLLDPWSGQLRAHLLPGLDATPLDVTPDGRWLLIKVGRLRPKIHRLDLERARLVHTDLPGETA